MLSWPFTMTSVPCGAATSASYIHKPLYSCNVLDYLCLRNDQLPQWMCLQNAFIRVFRTKCGGLENIGDICICSTRWAFPQRPTTALKVQLTWSDLPPLWKTPHVCNNSGNIVQPMQWLQLLSWCVEKDILLLTLWLSYSLRVKILFSFQCQRWSWHFSKTSEAQSETQHPHRENWIGSWSKTGCPALDTGEMYQYWRDVLILEKCINWRNILMLENCTNTGEMY